MILSMYLLSKSNAYHLLIHRILEYNDCNWILVYILDLNFYLYQEKNGWLSGEHYHIVESDSGEILQILILRALRAVGNGFQGNKPGKGPNKGQKTQKIHFITNISRGLQVKY